MHEPSECCINNYNSSVMLAWQANMDLLGGFETFEEHYNRVKRIVLANEDKYTEADIDDIDVDEDGPPEHLWSDIAPSTEESRSHS